MPAVGGAPLEGRPDHAVTAHARCPAPVLRTDDEVRTSVGRRLPPPGPTDLTENAISTSENLATTGEPPAPPAPLAPFAASGPVVRPVRPRDAAVHSYAELSRVVLAAGLQRRRYGYYWTCFALAVLSFATIWVGFALLRNSWFQLLVAAALALVSAQFGFLGHDAAHRQVFASPRWNEWSARIMSGAFAGLSYGWWMTKHNRHHSGPNQVERDPDIGAGVIAFTPEQTARRTGWFAAFTRRQGWWFFLLLPFEGVNLHVQSVLRVSGGAPMRLRALEAAFLVVRLGGYLALLFWLLPPGKAAAFVGVQLAVFGVLLGGAFAPNHIGMPIVPADARPDFLRRQVLMSRNISGGALVGFFMGGLNLQIEHHLFPNMPRPALKRARALVRAHCDRHDVGYTETTLLESYRQITRYLNAVGRRGADPFRCPLVTVYRG
jgi:fatty acid desaturase